jgi:hypothetical protein
MKNLVLVFSFIFLSTSAFAQDIVGDWIRTTGCANGAVMKQSFNANGTGQVTVPDCNKACAPFEYTMTFNWSTSGNTLTIEYLSVSEYCGVKQKAPGTFDMDFEASTKKLRIVGDHYTRQ